MKHLILTIPLLLIACVSMQEKSDELRDIAMACNEREQVSVMENGETVMRRPEGTCVAEWAAWNEAEEHAINVKKQRAARKKPKCPEGQVAYCDHWCMKGRSTKREWMCVDRWIFRNIGVN